MKHSSQVPDQTDSVNNDTDMRSILSRLKHVLCDHHGLQSIKSLLNQLATRLETIHACDNEKVSSFIKGLLCVRHGEITSRYIHQSLPGRYKRPYSRKREECSHLKFAKTIPNNLSNYENTRKGDVIEIRGTLDKQSLENVLRTLSLITRDKNPSVKILVSEKPPLFAKIVIGDQYKMPGKCTFTFFEKYSNPKPKPWHLDHIN
jgi:hypothetical protein